MKAKWKSKQVPPTKGQQKAALILELVICLFILAMCFGSGSNEKDSAKTTEKQEVVEQISEKQSVDYSTLFIEKYNASCRTPQLQVIEHFIPHEKGSAEEGYNYYYRTEFRLGAYKDALGIHCSIGDDLGSGSTVFKSMDVVYWPDKPRFRVYILDNSGEFATAFVDTIRVLHPDAFNDEFLSNLEESIKENMSIYDINKMIQEENFEMTTAIIYEDNSSGIVEGGIRVDE